MPKLEIELQSIVKLLRDHEGPVLARCGHLHQQLTVPGFTSWESLVNLQCDPAEQVFYPCIERVQKGSEGGELYRIRRLRAALFKERLVDLQQLLQLSLFDSDLLPEITPHAAGAPCS